MKKVIVFLLMSFHLNTIAQCVSPTLPVVVSSSSTICSGQSITLTITSGSLNSATNWQWYTGGCGSTAAGSGTQIVVNPATPATYFARGEGSCVIPGSCSTISINVTPTPTVAANSFNIMCFGQNNGSATVSASGIQPFTYAWSPTGFTSPIVYGLGPAPHSVTVTDVYGCKTFTTVSIFEPNVLSLNVAPGQTICYGNVAAIYASASGGTTPYQYTMTNLATNTTSNLTTPFGMNATPTLTSTTQFTAAVVDANGCSAGPKTLIVNLRPPLIAANSTVIACDRDSIVISPNIVSIGNGGPHSYSWINNPTTSHSISVIASLTNTPQSFTVSISDGCTIPGTSAVIIVSVSACVGIKENKISDLHISFYPNPANDILVIEKDEALAVKLFSAFGQELFHEEIISNKTIVDLSDLNNGIYFLSFYSKYEKVKTEKIIVQH
jgi:hypothetical protein